MPNYKYKQLFSDLRILLASLSQGEVAHATVLLSASKKYKVDSGVWCLYMALRKNPKLEWEEALAALGKNTDHDTLRKASKRLLVALSDSIVDRVSANRINNFTQAQKARALSALDLLKMPELIARGLTIFLDELIHATIKRASSAEDFYSLVQALHNKRITLILSGQHTAARAVGQELAAARKQQEILQEMDAISVLIGQQIADRGNSSQMALEVFEILTQAQELCKAAKSNKARLHLLYVESLWLYENGFVASALAQREKMLKLAQNQTIFSQSILNSTKLAIADCKVRLFCYDDAEHIINEVKRVCSKQSLNWWRCKELALELALYTGRWAAAQEQVARLQATEQTSERQYIRAMIAFAKADFFTAFVEVQELKSLNKDRSGWLVGIRLLICLSLLARHHDRTEHSGKALLQWYNRLGKPVKEKLRERDVLLIEAIVAMACEPIPGSGGLSADVSPQLEQLRAHPWEPFTYEVFDIAAMLGRIFKQRKWFTAAAPIELFEPLAVYRQAAAEQQAAQPPFKPAV